MLSMNWRVTSLAAALVLLAGCGSDTATSTFSTANGRGTLVESPPLRIASLSALTLQEELAASPSGTQLLLVTGNPVCGVDFHYYHYWTVDPAGAAIRNSGALMIPTGTGTCTGQRPVLLYAHGTQVDKTMNIADITDPANSEGALIATMFAAQGYIVVAPNYSGYDDSTLAYHPYLNADQESKDMIDALAAARGALGHVAAAGTTDNGKLFITGYSQGGHVAMATHRAMQAAGTTVTASAGMSGPYALEAFGDAIMYGNVDLGSTVFTPLLVTSYQHSYGNIYSAPTDVYETAYATGIDNILPSATPLATLFTSGKLPQLQLFHNTVWNTGSAQLDATLNVPNHPLYSLGFGASNLVKDSYRLSYIQDALAHPDGAVPAVTTLSPAAAPANTLRIAFKTNDLRTWKPSRPMMLCGGALDPTVFYPPNTTVIQNYFLAVQGLTPALLTVLDLESALGTPGPTNPFYAAKAGFAQGKASVSAGAGGGAAGANAVTQAYHGTLVPPFCSAAVRGFFSQF
jgi:acetyl esterase/lipase